MKRIAGKTDGKEVFGFAGFATIEGKQGGIAVENGAGRFVLRRVGEHFGSLLFAFVGLPGELTCLFIVAAHAGNIGFVEKLHGLSV